MHNSILCKRGGAWVRFFLWICSSSTLKARHKPVRRKFPKRRVISYGIDKIWSAGLVEMQKFSKWNKGIKYLLMVIDVFSKYGWIKTLKNKKGPTVAGAFNEIFKSSKRSPEMLWVDKGSEFYNSYVNELLNSKGIKLYLTENEEKSSVVERWNRTMKEKIWKMFTVNNNTYSLLRQARRITS